MMGDLGVFVANPCKSFYSNIQQLYDILASRQEMPDGEDDISCVVIDAYDEVRIHPTHTI